MNGRCTWQIAAKRIFDTTRYLIVYAFSLCLSPLAVPSSLPALEKFQSRTRRAFRVLHRSCTGSTGDFWDENIDLEYRILRADIGIKALLNGEVDYTYSAGTAIRHLSEAAPIRALSYDGKDSSTSWADPE
jgi:hypothetical protein